MPATALPNKRVTLQLAGLDSNAFSIIGAFSRQARRENWTPEEINAVIEESTKGDYQHLLRTFMAVCEDPEE